MNDENRDTAGAYSMTRCKVERITINRNTDPAMNNGNSLGGWTDATTCGWETCRGTITLTDNIYHQDNPNQSGQIPQHLQMTTVGSRNPQGGRMYVYGGTFENAGFPILNGYICYRISDKTYWYLDGYQNTIFAYTPSGSRLTAHRYQGAWPPSAAYLSSNGLSPDTHYIVNVIA
jgi:hypothetical protein